MAPIGAAAPPSGGRLAPSTAAPAAAQGGEAGARRRAGQQGKHPIKLAEGVRELLHTAELHKEQRDRLIVVLALAQLALAVATAPGYVFPQLDLAGLATVAGLALVSLLALTIARLLRSIDGAGSALVGGAMLVTAAHLGLVGMAGDVPGATQAALFFVPLILAAGVLFTAEITVGLLGLSLALTAAGLLFAASQAKAPPSNAVYLAVISATSLQALAGLIGWLVANFLAESAAMAHEAAKGLMARAELDAVQATQADQQRRLRAEIQTLQDAITRMLSGAYVDRVDVVPGELAKLMQSFNLLLDHLHSSSSDQASEHTNELITQMLTVIGEITSGSSSPSRVIPPAAAGPLSGVLHALVQLQGRSASHYGHLIELASDVAGAVQTSLDGLGNTAQDVAAARDAVGKLVAAVDQLTRSAGNSHAFVLHARDAVGKLLPAALVQAAAQDALHRDASGLTPDEAAKLLGRADDLAGLDVLDPDATGEFDALSLEAVGAREGDAARDLPSLTIPLPALSVDESSAGDASAGAPGERETQSQLLELWRMLDRLATTLGREHRALKSVLRELGKLSRSVRNADAGLAHGGASFDAALSATKQLQQTIRPPRGPAYGERSSPSARPASQTARPADSAPRAHDLPARPGAAELLGPGDVAGDSFSASRSGERTGSNDWGVTADAQEQPASDASSGSADGIGSFDLRELIDTDVFTGSSLGVGGRGHGDGDDPAQ